MSVFFAVDQKGRRRQLKAAALELVLADGRSLRLAPGTSADEFSLSASVGGGEAVMLLQPVAASMMSVRIVPPSPKAAVAGGKLTLAVQKAVRKRGAEGVPRRREILRWASAALERDAEVTVRIVDAAEGRELNEVYRGKDYATNVLTFAYHEGEAMPLLEGMALVGDLVLCAPIVAAEAAAQGKTLDAHYAHLVVHGMLHLQGYDHEVDAEAGHMESREREILANLGYPDPYAGQ